MIIEFALEHPSIERGKTREQLDGNRRLLHRVELPLGANAECLQAVLWSSLLTNLEVGGTRTILDEVLVPRLTKIEEPTPAEYARLMSKGRLLYEHCMTEVSHMCMVGFMDHELKKSRTAERIVFDLMDWIVLQRLDLAELQDHEGDDAACRVAHTDYILDLAVSFLHGLTREQALHLAADRKPD